MKAREMAMILVNKTDSCFNLERRLCSLKNVTGGKDWETMFLVCWLLLDMFWQGFITSKKKLDDL